MSDKISGPKDSHRTNRHRWNFITLLVVGGRLMLQNPQDHRSLTNDEPPEAAHSALLSPEERARVEENVPLVHHIVARLASRFPSTYCRDDLIQAGTLGLIEAAQRFEPSLGFSFSTYAGRRIEGAAIDSIRRDDWAPRSVRSGQRLLSETRTQLTAKLGRTPSNEELFRESGLPQAQFRRLQADVATAQVESLHQTTDRPDGNSDSAVPTLDRESPMMPGIDVERRETIETLRAGLAGLSERHRIVIVGHFLDGKTMTELGRFLGVTQSRASQLKAEALRQLRERFGAELDGTAFAAGEIDLTDRSASLIHV
jgi:RNA polymerase sigma factor for flagellar operon FliA